MSNLSLQSISSTFNGLQTELDSLKSLTGVALANGIADLKNKIVDARVAQLAALERINELEAKVVEFENWERESSRYQTMKFDPGVTVYIERGANQPVEQVQHFCPQCYANRKIRMLQATGDTFGRRAKRTCLECNSTLAYGYQAPMPQTRVVDDYHPFGRGR